MDNFSLIKYLVGASRIKYDKLDIIFKDIKIKESHVTLYVDAHSIFYRLYRNNAISALQSCDADTLVSDIVIAFINVLGHYRRYIATRFHKSNDIFVVFNRELPKYHGKFYPEYNAKLYDQYDKKHKDYGALNDIVDKAYSFVRCIIPYCEGIYCIDNSGIDDCSLIYDLIQNFHLDKPSYNIVLSRNMLATQMVTSDTVMLVNKRDDSYLITPKNVYKDGVLYDRSTEASDKLTVSMLPLLWTMAGCKDVGVATTNHINGIVAMVKQMNKMVKESRLIDKMSIQSFLDEVEPYTKSKDIKSDLDDLQDRYRVLSLDVASKGITSNQRARVAADLYNLYDETGLENLNDLLSMRDDPELLEITNLNMSTIYEDNSTYDGGW